MPEVTTAVLLAAGRGTRMGALTAATPKPLLEVAGRPILEHILTGLARAGIARAVVVTGYLGERIERRLGDGAALGLAIRYARQERAQGTAKALLAAEPLAGSGPFVLGWGDILIDPGFYAALVEDFRRDPCDLLLGVNEVDDPWQGGAVYVDAAWHVTRIVEKPPRGSSTTRWNNAGIFVASPLLWDCARRLGPSPRGEYELPQAMSQMIDDGRAVRALPVRGFWSDVGTPADLDAARRSFPVPSDRSDGSDGSVR